MIESIPSFRDTSWRMRVFAQSKMIIHTPASHSHAPVRSRRLHVPIRWALATIQIDSHIPREVNS